MKAILASLCLFSILTTVGADAYPRRFEKSDPHAGEVAPYDPGVLYGNNTTLQGGTSSSTLQGGTSAATLQGGVNESMIKATVSEIERRYGMKAKATKWSAKKRYGKRLPALDHTNTSFLQGEVQTEGQRVLYQAFLAMNCIEFNELHANYYTADKNYRPIGTAVGARGGVPGREQSLVWGGHTHKVHMGLPSYRGGTVYLYTDDSHLIAVDPNGYTTWVWNEPKAKNASGTWKKLSHERKST